MSQENIQLDLSQHSAHYLEGSRRSARHLLSSMIQATLFRLWDDFVDLKDFPIEGIV